MRRAPTRAPTRSPQSKTTAAVRMQTQRPPPPCPAGVAADGGGFSPTVFRPLATISAATAFMRMNWDKPATVKQQSQMWKADPDGEAKGQLTTPQSRLPQVGMRTDFQTEEAEVNKDGHVPPCDGASTRYSRPEHPGRQSGRPRRRRTNTKNKNNSANARGEKIGHATEAQQVSYQKKEGYGRPPTQKP